ncbi:MAG: hypothetical protein K2M23_01670 [Alphaproteobacteria bacterium]|nr:hypothetical protein [Alphaproteobacteria bacterium]
MKNNLKISLIALSTILTACGGGGSGSGNSVPTTTLPTISSDVEKSNRQITSLKNRIDITKAKPESVRSATSKVNEHYANIGDIEFKVCDEDKCGKSKFELDENGKIVSWSGYKLDGSGVLLVKDAPEGNHMKYNEMTLKSMGKELELSYFDFFKYNDTVIEYGDDGNGHITTKENGEKRENQYGLFGGYKEREISPNKVEKDIASIDFTGKAVGGVETRLHREGENFRDKKSIALEGNAKLNFKNGDIPTSTLTMNFDNWYDVVIKQNGDISDNNFSVEFTNFTGDDAEFKFDKTKYENSDINNYSFAYYYDDATNKVVEAGGGIEVIDKKITYPESHKENEPFKDFKDNLQAGEHAIDFNAAFGLKRD